MAAGWSYNLSHGRESMVREENIVVGTAYIHQVDIFQSSS